MCSRASLSTQTLNTHVLQSLLVNTNIKYSCVPELLAQHKTSNTHVLQTFLLNIKHQILMCLTTCAQHKHLINYVLQGPHLTHKIIYIKHMQLAYTKYIKQIIILMCSGVLFPIYKIKHQNNIISNGAYSYKC